MSCTALDAFPATSDIKEQLEARTLEAVCGRSFVRSQLRSWLLSQSAEGHVRLARLIFAAHELQAAKEPGLSVPLHVVHEGRLMLFCVLLETETGQPQFYLLEMNAK